MRPPRALRRALDRAARLRARGATWRASRQPPVVRLDGIRRRLELLLAGLYGEGLVVEAREPEPKRWIERLWPEPAHLRGRDRLPTLDGARIQHPEEDEPA